VPKILQSTRELHGRWTSFGRKQNEKHKHHRSHYISWVLIKRKLIIQGRQSENDESSMTTKDEEPTMLRHAASSAVTINLIH